MTSISRNRFGNGPTKIPHIAESYSRLHRNKIDGPPPNTVQDIISRKDTDTKKHP